MSKKWSALSWLALALVAVPAFGSAPPRASLETRCELRLTQIPEGLRIAGIVHGRPGTSGVYQLELAKLGTGGDSQVSQGGAYTLSASSEATVSASDVNLAPGDAYRASMTVRNLGGTSHCDRHAP